MGDKLSEARMREIEAVVESLTDPELVQADRDDLIAEIRRLRGEAQAGYEWMAKATLWEDERDKARKMVDALLDNWPWRRTTQGRICPGCHTHETQLRSKECVWFRVQQARDWEPTT